MEAYNNSRTSISHFACRQVGLRIISTSRQPAEWAYWSSCWLLGSQLLGWMVIKWLGQTGLLGLVGEHAFWLFGFVSASQIWFERELNDVFDLVNTFWWLDFLTKSLGIWSKKSSDSGAARPPTHYKCIDRLLVSLIIHLLVLEGVILLLPTQLEVVTANRLTR